MIEPTKKKGGHSNEEPPKSRGATGIALIGNRAEIIEFLRHCDWEVVSIRALHCQNVPATRAQKRKKSANSSSFLRKGSPAVETIEVSGGCPQGAPR